MDDSIVIPVDRRAQVLRMYIEVLKNKIVELNDRITVLESRKE